VAGGIEIKANSVQFQLKLVGTELGNRLLTKIIKHTRHFPIQDAARRNGYIIEFETQTYFKLLFILLKLILKIRMIPSIIIVKQYKKMFKIKRKV